MSYKYCPTNGCTRTAWAALPWLLVSPTWPKQPVSRVVGLSYYGGTMSRYIINSIMMLFIIFSFSSCASNTPQIPIDNQDNISDRINNSGWMNFSKINIQLGSDSESYDIIKFNIFENNDFKVDIENQTVDGTILMISGKYMLVKNMDLTPGYEIDTLDYTVLMMQAAIQMLYYSFPNGPPKQPTTYSINVVNKKDSIYVHTMSAHGEWKAPWKIKGDLSCIDPNHLSFNLSTKFKNMDPLQISGEWISETKQPSFPDETLLDGWQVHIIGVQHRVYDKNGNLIKEEGPRYPSKECKTFGDLRNTLIKK